MRIVTKRYLQRAVSLAVPVLIFLLLIRFFALDFGRVTGHSMEPILTDGQFFLVTKIGFLLQPPTRGAVVQLFVPEDEKKLALKRIIGLPGETVTVAGTTVTIETPAGTRLTLEEPYARWDAAAALVSLPPVTVPAYSYFVLGDNRQHSTDSRSYGAVHRRFIVGQAWPL